MVHSVKTLVLHKCSHGHLSPSGSLHGYYAMRSISEGAGLEITVEREVRLAAWLITFMGLIHSLVRRQT
jgi:hypothetical protein